jgi:branched-chain amino acid transport system substrate-binding protein
LKSGYIFADCKQFIENSLESPPMVAITEQFQILAVGECTAIRTVLTHSSVAHRFRLDSCPLHADIMASIDRVAPDLILVDADGTPKIRMHGPGMAAITAATRDLADYANRRGPIDAKVKAARALGTPDGRREAQELLKTPIPPAPFDVLLLADTGENLQEIAAVLPYYDVDRSAVQIIGPALWADPASGSGSVSGAWYAAPDNATRSDLEREYTAKYGSPPSPLADLAFDAASVAKVAVGPAGADTAILTQPGGFVGTDGWFTLLPDGQVRRGLAVFRIERGGPQLIDPAPQSAGSPGL